MSGKREEHLQDAPSHVCMSGKREEHLRDAPSHVRMSGRHSPVPV